jgi:LAO/AO transport system kinase
LSFDPNAYDQWFRDRKFYLDGLTASALFPKIRQGERMAISSAITLLESKNPTHRKEADQLIAKCLPYAGNAWRIGITGVPGVGKSTFIEAFGKLFLDEGHKMAIMAIDPSSSLSGGSILGDKTRMSFLSNHPNVYVRPTATGNNLGGVAQHTRETIILCEAAGFDRILIETVGVGQSETVVHSMVDFFLLLMLAGAGDELQGIKRGIMEMADGILITKADGNNRTQAKLAQKDYQNALHLFRTKDNGWDPKVACISSLANENLNLPLQWINDFFTKSTENGALAQRRNDQNVQYFDDALSLKIEAHIANDPLTKERYIEIKEAILAATKSPFQGADEMFTYLFKQDGI